MHNNKYARASALAQARVGSNKTLTQYDQNGLEQRESVRLVRLPCGSHVHDPPRLRSLDVQRRPRVSELERVLPSSRPKCRRSVHVASFHEYTAMLEDLTRASIGSVNTAYTVGGIVAGRSLRTLRGRK